MCRLRNIAMCDYQESATTGQTDTGQSDPYVSICFAGDTKRFWHEIRKMPRLAGLNFEFYQYFWDEIEDLFYNVVKHIYKKKKMSFSQSLAIQKTLIFKLDMCLWNTDNPPRQQSQNMAKSVSPTLWPPPPQGHVISVRCEQPLDELTVQVWYQNFN